MSENCGIEISIGRDALCNGIEVEAAAVQPPEIGVEVHVMGDNGLTPHIGSNGNWWIGEQDTGVRAEGREGPAGPQGERGAQGPQGPQGEPGRDGATGSQGPQGEQGPAGETGAQGPAGPQGIQGPKGDTGATGPQGPIGQDGAPGKDGTPGADGQPGTPGFSPIVSVADIDGGHRVTITDAEGEKSFDVLDGKDGEGGSGGASVQADWNAAEGEAGHVLNRPFYSQIETTVTEQLLASGVYTTEYVADFGIFAAIVKTDSSVQMHEPLFTVVFDGVEYPKLKYYSTDLGNLIGNGALIAPIFDALGAAAPEDTEEPFVFLVSLDEYMSSVTFATDITQSTTHDVSLIYVSETSEEKVVKLPEKYYDAGVGMRTSGGEVFNDYDDNVAIGGHSHAEGFHTTARGYTSHAEGYDTTASGDYSHAEGRNTTASGDYSHAEGSGSAASGVYSHAEGYYTTASGGNSHAEGWYTIARARLQHVQGKYNIADKNEQYAHIVGNGEEEITRSNAHTIDWDGVGWFAGGVKIGGTGQNDEASDWLVTRKELEGLRDGSGETIPDYVISEADSVINRIAAAQSGRTFTFAAITDMHFGQGDYTDGVKHACQALKYIDERIKLDAVAVLGDYTDGYADRDGQYENAIADFREVNSVLSDLRFAPNLRMHGNHDYINDRMPEIFRYTAAYSAEDAVWGGGSYFYRDFGRCKLRIICLDTVCDDTGNVGYTDEQAQWFADALDLSGKADAADWQVLVLSHHPVDFNHAEGNPYRFVGIIDAYVRGASYASGNVSCNFAGKNAATFVGNIHGHIHNLLVDRIYKDGVYAGNQIDALRIATPEACYGRTNGYDGVWQEEISYSKTQNTAKDTSFVVYCINLDSKTIEAVCYGAGYDRTIDYDIGGGESGGYTNQIPIATDQNGNTVVDGAMYTDSRWSSSGGVSSAPGYFITGLIPAKPGDFVRIRWNNTELYGDTGYQCVRAFGSDRTPIDTRLPFQYMFDPSNEAGAAFTSEEGFYYDFENGILDFRVLAYSSIPADTVYLTFVLSGDPAETIITVNEEITTE